MISVIICSRNPAISPQLADNLRETIGVVYEVIVIGNMDGQYSIFQAYNLGVSKASFPLLCFMHDDILLHSPNWGLLVKNHFDNVQTGAIGVAGSPYVPQMPGSWWGGDLVNQQLLVKKNENLVPFTKTVKNDLGHKSQVVVLDGLWFCVRREIFDRIQFDERSYQGFHFYDIDICMQIHAIGYRIYSIFNIFLEHVSPGKMDLFWAENALIFHRKWASRLPASVIGLSYNEACEAELKTLNEYNRVLLANNVHPKKVFRAAIGFLLKFWRGYLYYKTSVNFARYIIRGYVPKMNRK